MERVIPPIETLRTPRLILRAVAPEDAPSIAVVCAPKEVAMNTLKTPHPYTLDDAYAFLGRVADGVAKNELYSWGITLADAPDRYIGTFGLHPNWEHRHAEVGYIIAMPEWGRGYATEAVRAVIAFAFERTPLVRLHAGYYTRNPASGRVLEKCGFVPEGVRPRMYERFGEWIDLALMRLFREDWARARQQ